MTEVIELNAERRTNKGTGDARALRREGKIPAIVYGGKGEELRVALESRLLSQAYHKGGFKTKVVKLKLDKEEVQVLPRDIQFHPVTDMPLHADFLRISKDTKVNVMVAVKFHNEDKAPGLKRGGILNVVRHEVELFCPADAIPEALHADLTGLQIGDSLHISSITLPENVTTVIKDRDFTVATIAGRTAKEEAEEVAAAEGEEAEGAEAVEGEEAASEESAGEDKDKS